MLTKPNRGIYKRIIEKSVNRPYILQLRSLFSETKNELCQTLNDFSIKLLRKILINKYVCKSGINPVSNLSKRVSRRYILQLRSLIF